MKLIITAGAALAALTMAADARAERNVVVIHRGGDAELALDANRDGWVTRAEASAAADANFATLDANSDGRLNVDDRGEMEIFELHLEGEEGERIQREVEIDIERAHRDIERAQRDAEHAEREAHRIERNVIIIRGDGDAFAPLPPEPPEPSEPAEPPAPPHPPMFMMLVADTDEADANGDGALSRDEFRAQQLRFFDAGDANGDGRIRFNVPEAPPAPPIAPPHHR